MCQIITAGNYRLIRKIGKGGFGTVWLAEDSRDLSLRALKEIFSLRKDSHERRALDLYMSKLARNPCGEIIAITDVFDEGEKTFYAMPLCDGDGSAEDPRSPDWQSLTLERLISKKRESGTWFTAEEVAEIMEHVARAAGKISEMGLVHRDIKPANILYKGGKPCVADIGLIAPDTPSLSVAGTPDYTAPEWYLRASGNPDMWGCAATLYTVLTGNSPDLMGRPAYMWQPCGKENMRPEDVAKWTSLHNVANRATRERAKDRYLTFDDFIADIERAANGVKIGAPTTGEPARFPAIEAKIKESALKKIKPKRIFWGAGTLITLLCLPFLFANIFKSSGKTTEQNLEQYMATLPRAEKIKLLKECRERLIANRHNEKDLIRNFKEAVIIASSIVPTQPGEEIYSTLRMMRVNGIYDNDLYGVMARLEDYYERKGDTKSADNARKAMCFIAATDKSLTTGATEIDAGKKNELREYVTKKIDKFLSEQDPKKSLEIMKREIESLFAMYVPYLALPYTKENIKRLLDVKAKMRAYGSSIAEVADSHTKRYLKSAPDELKDFAKTLQ